jgi:hypothetical protein
MMARDSEAVELVRRIRNADLDEAIQELDEALDADEEGWWGPDTEGRINFDVHDAIVSAADRVSRLLRELRR